MNTGYNTVTYYLQNDINSTQEYQQIPISPNNKLIQPDSFYTYITKNNINTNGKNNNVYYPERKNKDMAEILSNKSRSPTVIRKNNFLINDQDPKVTTNYYARSPNHSINNQKNNNYNNISSFSPDRLSTNEKITVNNLSSVKPNYNSNNTQIVNSYSALLYPSSPNNYNYVTNNKNNNVSNFYEIPNSITSPSSNVTYYTISPNSPSTDNLINNIGSTTYETKNILTNEKSSNNINDMISMVPYVNIINANENYPNTINQVANNNNYIVTPSKQNNEIQVISYPFNSINTIPSTNKYIQINSSSPNNNTNINSNPSSADKLISHYSYQNVISPIDKNNNYANGNTSNQELIPLKNNNNNNPNSIQRLQTSPTVSKFNNINNNKYNNPNKKENNAKNILSKKTKNFKKIVNSSSSKTESSSEGLGGLIFSKAKKYITKKFEDNSNDSENDEKDQEEVNSDINNKNNGKSEKEYSFKNNNNDYNIKSNLIKNDSVEIEPDEYYSQYMFSQINKIRTNPKSFIPKIKNAIKNISNDKKSGKLIYKGRLKVSLYKGEKAFTDAISELEKIEPMEPLEFRKELCVDISEDETEFKSGDYLREKIKEKIDDGIIVRAFWRDIIKDPEINFLLMIVDDNAIRRGDKRNDILDPNMKYIGINSASLGNNFVCYTVLSDE